MNCTHSFLLCYQLFQLLVSIKLQFVRFVWFTTTSKGLECLINYWNFYPRIQKVVFFVFLLPISLKASIGIGSKPFHQGQYLWLCIRFTLEESLQGWKLSLNWVNFWALVDFFKNYSWSCVKFPAFCYLERNTRRWMVVSLRCNMPGCWKACQK